MELNANQIEELNRIKLEVDKRYKPFSPYATKEPEDDSSIRYFNCRSDFSLRGSFGIDVDKILHNPFYNRYADKTQVFSFYKSDEITRRATHVQLVSRISRILAKSLGLNMDLTEAIALGHDIGHTPFGHVGEMYLNELYHESTGRFFNHNVHSVRNLKVVTPTNLTIPTMDGILCHNGEKPAGEYYPSEPKNRAEFEEMFEKCYTEEGFVDTLRPFTLEGCVVRVSDIIAYVMKDRQDAEKVGLDVSYDEPGVLGDGNFSMLGLILSDIVLNSYGKPYIKMSKEIFEDLYRLKKENASKIYMADNVNAIYDVTVRVMMNKLYHRLKKDLEEENKSSYIYKHHIYHKNFSKYYEKCNVPYDDIVIDYIAGMTDDYFIDLYEQLYGQDEVTKQVKYIGYFD